MTKTGNNSNHATRNGMLNLLQEEVLELRRVNEQLTKENERLRLKLDDMWCVQTADTE